MKLVRLVPYQPTHVVADARHCLTFDEHAFATARLRMHDFFGIEPADLHELANHWTASRPDLLIGVFHPKPDTITVMGEGVSLDPRTSKVIKRAVALTGATRVRRMLVNVPYDVWCTELHEIRGAVPSVLFHGTSDAHLAEIISEGLRTDCPQNWQAGGHGNVYLTATPQTAAFHARRTAGLDGGAPIVFKCRRPWCLDPDWDVIQLLVESPEVPGANGRRFARETGLFASRRAVSKFGILAAYTPVLSASLANWEVIYAAPRSHELLSWMLR